MVSHDPEPSVCVVIVHFNSRADLWACLQSCQAIEYGNYEIILVENGSRIPLELDEVRNLCDRVRKVLKIPVNIGYPRAANVGLREALAHRPEYVLLLNDDTKVAPGFLKVLVDAGEAIADAGGLGPAIYYSDAPTKMWASGGRIDLTMCQLRTFDLQESLQRDGWNPLALEFLTGCCLLVKRRVLEAIGLFDERFYLYWEDADFMVRMNQAGFKNVLVPSASIWHKGSASVGGHKSPFQVYHLTRSQLLFAKLHAPRALSHLRRVILRTIGSLLFKSKETGRFQEARAYFLALRDYHLNRLDRGPDWLWRQLSVPG
jgi:GT2 family glycosyltransferase